ncbi:MAG: toll/interleukin-1 receptor domain-containing protein [Hyphomicrobiaceae bacterium]
MSAQSGRKYRAFLSYSHKDRAAAARLHKVLEGFTIDKDLVGRRTRWGAVPNALRPIFRDRTDLAAAHSLDERIKTALEQSEFLIVVCSPNAAGSRHVDAEIARFKAMGRAERVLAFIVAGEPGAGDQECFPPALRFEIDGDGKVTEKPEEPIAADAREVGDGEELATQKVVAGLLGVELDEIRKRFALAERRRKRIWAGIAAGMAVMAVAAGFGWWQAYSLNRKQAALLETALDAASGLVQKGASLPEEKGVAVPVALDFVREAEGLLDGLEQGLRRSQTVTLRRRQASLQLAYADSYMRLGKPEQQLEWATRAQTLLEDLRRQAPKDGDLALALARSEVAIGDAHRARSRYSDAVAVYAKAISRAEALLAVATDKAPVHEALSDVNDKLARTLQIQSYADPTLKADAVKAGEAAVRHADLLPVDRPDLEAALLKRYLMTRAGASLGLSFVLDRQKQFPRALEMARATIAIRDRLLARFPGEPQLQLMLATAQNHLGNMHAERRQFPEALAAYGAARAAIEAVALADRGHAPRQAAYARALTGHAWALRNANQHAQAIDALTRADETMAHLLALAPKSTIWRRQRSEVQDELGYTHTMLKDHEKAFAAHLRSLELRKTLRAEIVGEDKTIDASVALAHTQVGLSLQRLRRHKDAIEHFAAALALRRQRMTAERNPGTQRLVAQALEWLAESQLARARKADALTNLEEARALRQDVLTALKGEAQSQRNLAETYRQLALALMAGGRDEQALASMRDASRHIREAMEKAPTRKEWVWQLRRITKGVEDLERRLAPRPGPVAPGEAPPPPANTGAGR